jgi:Mrp family chromosome partitioning ATPase
MSDALVSQRMETVLEDLGEGMDIVLLDAPPINLVSDAAVLARRADGALLVCRAGMTRRHDVREARHMLERVDAQILGVVLTDVDER